MILVRSSALLCLMAASTAAWAEAPPVITTEPLVLASKNVAIQRAQRTLLEAGGLVRGELDSAVIPGIGIHANHYALGTISFRNPSVVYRNDADGNRVHYGYTFQMKAGSDINAPWVSIVAGRRGRIANRLFSGADSVFALASPHLPEGGLDRVMAKDLENEHSLDLVAKWNARRQAKLGGTRPLVVRSSTPGAKPAVTPVVAKPVAPVVQGGKIRKILRSLKLGK